MLTTESGPDEGAGEPQLAAMVLRTMFSGVQLGPSTEETTPLESVAVDWQTMGQHANWAELHAVTNGATQGRGFELVGRVAAAGEQLGLAGTCQLEAQRWQQADRPAARGADVATRALAEMTGYYAMSAGHGLINVTLRTLLLSPACAGR